MLLNPLFVTDNVFFSNLHNFYILYSHLTFLFNHSNYIPKYEKGSRTGTCQDTHTSICPPGRTALFVLFTNPKFINQKLDFLIRGLFTSPLNSTRVKDIQNPLLNVACTLTRERNTLKMSFACHVYFHIIMNCLKSVMV